MELQVRGRREVMWKGDVVWLNGRGPNGEVTWGQGKIEKHEMQILRGDGQQVNGLLKGPLPLGMKSTQVPFSYLPPFASRSYLHS